MSADHSAVAGHQDHDDHAHHLNHQFDDLDQQTEAANLGMWIFLITEVMFFGGLFLGYTVYRTSYPESFVAGSHELDVLLGSINTVILIMSSLTMAFAVRSAQLGKRNLILLFLFLTLLLGSVFLGIKYVEYSAKFAHHLVPGPNFEWAGAGAHRSVQLFFSFYFGMTGMHALHMIIGAGLIIWLMIRALQNTFTPEYYAPVENFGLYWHFVDLVWIFLFPMFYLLGLHD